MHRVPAEAHPLTEGQASIWLADQLAAPSAAYHTTVALTVDGKFGRGDLERVARDLVDGTPALRIIMGPDASGSLRQWFSDTPVDVRWLAEPVEDPGGPGFTPPLRRMVTEPFRSDGGPLCRLVGADVAGGRRAVVLVAHHLINDGISQPQLARRLADLITGRAVPHEPVDRYLSLLATVRHAEQAASVDDASYWEHRLADHLNDPTDPLIDICQMPGGHVRMEFPDWVAERVTELAKEVGGTPFLVLLGAVHRTLAADGRERSVVAAAVSVRPAGGRYDDVVGCFTNVLPLVTVHRPQESLYDLLVREVPGWREDLRRRCVPVGDVVNRLKVASRRRGLYSVMVSIRTIPPVYRARGRTAVRADLMKRHYGAKADLAIRILRQGRSMFYDAEWRDGVPRDTAELCDILDTDTVATALPVSLRSTDDDDAAHGLYLNSLPVVLTDLRSTGLADQVDRLAQTMPDLLQARRLPVTVVADALRSRGIPIRASLLPTVVTVRHAMPGPSVRDGDVRPLPVVPPTTLSDLAIIFLLDEDAIRMEVRFRTGLITTADAMRIATAIDQTLGAAVGSTAPR